MKKLFFAYLFIFINFSINIGHSSISLIPTFVGYIIMLSAFRELEHESSEFSRLRPYATGMAIYTGICWLIDIIGVPFFDPDSVILPVMLALISLIVSLYILKYVIAGIEDIERNYSADLKTDRLHSVYKILAPAQILSIIMLIIAPLAVVAMIVSFVSAIILLIRLNDTARAYEAL